MQSVTENFPATPGVVRENSGPIGPKLSPIEAQTLDLCEQVIQRGLETFIDVGVRLAQIRDQRLYRDNFGTFEAYCESRWEMTGRYARRVCAAAEVTKLLSASGFAQVPETESQARPLTALPAPEVIEVWTEIVRTAPLGKVTARFVQDVVAEKLGRPAQATGTKIVEPRLPRPMATARSGSPPSQIRICISEVRALIDQLGTTDSVAGSEATSALYRLEKLESHLARSTARAQL